MTTVFGSIPYVQTTEIPESVCEDFGVGWREQPPLSYLIRLLRSLWSLGLSGQKLLKAINVVYRHD